MMLSTKSEEVVFVAVDQEPDFITQQEKVSKLASEFHSAEVRFLEINKLLNTPDRYGYQEIAPPSKLEFLEADVAMPEARLRYRKCQVESEHEAGILQALRNRLRQELTVARTRSGERRVMMKKMFEKFREAEQLVWQIADFDMETARLGGDRPPMLFSDFGRGVGDESYLGRREHLARGRGELE